MGGTERGVAKWARRIQMEPALSPRTPGQIHPHRPHSLHPTIGGKKRWNGIAEMISIG